MYRYRVTGEIVGLEIGQVLVLDHEIARGFRTAVERIHSDTPMVVAEPKKRGRPKKDRHADENAGAGLSDGQPGNGD